MHLKIQFSVEEENNNQINFLDLSISRTHNNLKFGIPYLHVYKPHFLTRICTPKFGCGFYTGFKKLDPPRKSRYHIDD
jgi:hypothetical protein